GRSRGSHGTKGDHWQWSRNGAKGDSRSEITFGFWRVWLYNVEEADRIRSKRGNRWFCSSDRTTRLSFNQTVKKDAARRARKSESSMDAFETSLQHLLAELERIDLLIAAQVARARKLYTSDEQFRGLYISEEEVNALLKQPLGFPRWARGQTSVGDLTVTQENISQ